MSRHLPSLTTANLPPILSARLTDWLPLPCLACKRFRYRSLIWARFQACGLIMLPCTLSPLSYVGSRVQRAMRGLFQLEDTVVKRWDIILRLVKAAVMSIRSLR